MLGDYWPALLCLFLAAALTFAEMRDLRAVQWLIKPLASTCFVIQAVMLGAVESAYGVIVLIALSLCCIGDIILIPRDREELFKAGIGIFLAGHIAYIVAFLTGGTSFLFLYIGGMIMSLITFVYWRHIGFRLPPEFRIPVGAYTVVIFVMVLVAFGAAGASGKWVLPAAALMFAISDMVVGQDRFVKSVPGNFVIITPLYYGAQVLFALSV